MYLVILGTFAYFASNIEVEEEQVNKHALHFLWVKNIIAFFDGFHKKKPCVIPGYQVNRFHFSWSMFQRASTLVNIWKYPEVKPF